MRTIPRTCGALLGLVGLLSGARVVAAELEVVLRNAGSPVADAVVELIDASGRPPVPAAAVMDQVNSEFVPRQLVVTRGSPVSFPNSDSTRHQVYSFSPAKRFELPLYSGTPPEPVTFGTAGVVTLGCNIHDAMIGFIVVVDSDRWGSSDPDGTVTFQDLPPGRYTLRLWHERLAGGQREQAVELAGEGALRETIELDLNPPPPPRGSDRLRALQDRLRERQREPD